MNGDTDEIKRNIVEFPSGVPRVGQVVRILVRHPFDSEQSKQYPMDGIVIARTFSGDKNPIIGVSDVFNGTNRPMVFVLDKEEKWRDARDVPPQKTKPLIKIFSLD